MLIIMLYNKFKTEAGPVKEAISLFLLILIPFPFQMDLACCLEIGLF